MVVRSAGGERTVAAAEFFLGYLTSALDDSELLTAVRFPPWPSSTGWSVQEVSRRHGDYALVGLRNLVHASDAPETAKSEIELWFPEGVLSYTRDVERWMTDEGAPS